MPTQKTYKYKALSIDGGGVRGIIPVLFLHKISELTGKPIHKLFDFIAGTSIGGITAAGFACGYDTKTMLDLYKNGSAQIFPHSTTRKIETVGGLLAPKYDRAGLDKLLEKHFGDKLLSDADIPICVTSYDLDSANAKVWSSLDAVKGVISDVKMKDIAAATSAAPTFFAAAEFSDLSGQVHHEVDGGIFLNSPQVLALDEILKNDPDVTREDILLISMGTGKSKKQWDVDTLKNAGLKDWLKGGQIISLIMDANYDFANMQASIHYPNMYRLQIEIPKELKSMDKSSPKHLKKLMDAANKYIEDNSSKFEEIAKLLTFEHYDAPGVLVSDDPHMESLA